MPTCVNCGDDAKVKFCSRSCSASYTNKTSPKRKPEHECLYCQSPTLRQSKFCRKDCRDSYYNLNTTIGDLRKKAIRQAQVYNYLRQKSRQIALATILMRCQVCHYDIHVDVCHIAALASLSDDTLVKNAVCAENFVILCKNHHWELDHGHLTIAEVPPSDLLPQLDSNQ